MTELDTLRGGDVQTDDHYNGFVFGYDPVFEADGSHIEDCQLKATKYDVGGDVDAIEVEAFFNALPQTITIIVSEARFEADDEGDYTIDGEQYRRYWTGVHHEERNARDIDSLDDVLERVEEVMNDY